MKVLVLSGRFGMGHEMAANAICEQFRKLDKDTEIVKKDLLEELYPHISKLIFGGFRLGGFGDGLHRSVFPDA